MFIVGLVFLPIIFAWFTLRDGYSNKVRGLAFGWLVFTLLLGILSPNNADKTNDALKTQDPQLEVQENDAREKQERKRGLTSQEAQPTNLQQNPNQNIGLKIIDRSKIDPSVYKPYNNVDNKLALQQFGSRAQDIQNLRVLFAEKVMQEGLCESVSMSEVVLDSSLQNPNFYVWCQKPNAREQVQIYASEQQIRGGGIGQEIGLSETEAVVRCRRIILDNTKNLSDVKVHYIADSVFTKYNDGTGNSRVVVGFSGKNAFNQKLSYRATCDFNKEGGPTGFSVDYK